jgi:hypothetical protein
MDNEAVTDTPTRARGAFDASPPLQSNSLNRGRAFLIALPGLLTVIIWEFAAWQWPTRSSGARVPTLSSTQT